MFIPDWDIHMDSSYMKRCPYLNAQSIIARLDRQYIYIYQNIHIVGHIVVTKLLWALGMFCFCYINRAMNNRKYWLTLLSYFTFKVNSLRPSDAYIRQLTNIIGSDNGVSPGRRQAIIWTNAGIFFIGPLGP